MFGLEPYIWIPLFFMQWVGAIACLVMLAKMRFSPIYKISNAKFWFFNLTILLVVVLGIINFLVCRFIFPRKVFGKNANPDETIVRDAENDTEPDESGSIVTDIEEEQ